MHLQILLGVMRLVRFSVDVVRSMQSEAKGKSSRLDRAFSISLKQLIALLLFVIVVSAVGYWAVQRVDMYGRWRSQFEISQSLRTHLDKAYILLTSSDFETDNITQNWFYSEVQYAIHSVGDLLRKGVGSNTSIFTTGHPLLYCLFQSFFSKITLMPVPN
jgi:hypothetical protein